MIIAQNIIVKNNIISFDYQLEDFEKKHIAYDMNSKQFLEYEDDFTESMSEVLYEHMIKHIIEDVKNNSVVSNKQIMWY